MKKKATKSYSTTQSITDQSIEDNRIVVSDEGVAYGKVELAEGATITQQFPPEVQQAFSSLIELAAGTGEVAGTLIDQSIRAQERSSAEFVASVEGIAAGTTALTKILPYMLVGIGGIILIAMFGKKR